MKEVILTRNLCRYFGKTKAVDDISISIEKGEIYGFLGLNGAGKTTTIRMLLGMIRPTSGASFIDGEQVSGGKPHLWKKVGALVEIPYSYPDLSVEENLDIIRQLRSLGSRRALDRIIEKLNLTPYRHIPAKNLSLGNAQRLGLAKAMMHDPEILILDEPANGLDPAGIVEIRELLLDLAGNKGVTIFLSSHILGEISKFASRIGIIHEGKLLLETDMDDLEKMRKKTLHLKTKDLFSTQGILEKNGFNPSLNPDEIIEMTDPLAVDNPAMIATTLVNEGYPPSLLKVEEEDLESFFLRVINIKKGS